ncbi:alpha/beta fold hydrolase [Bosea sp. LjRoot237]|uniref:alpha/beta fold hydrolase n=1 Tax=Bosea sp. LjRoot237 TaxID=3342292 RepID=UPI003ECC7977
MTQDSFSRRDAFVALSATATGGAFSGFAAPAQAKASTQPTHHRTITIDGIEIFYREAGPADAPVLLLLHGFPSSSRMFRNLIPALSDRYRVIAPDYPGFGHSAVPDRASFKYGFARFAELIDTFLTELRIDRFALYVMDYGAPVGFRLALKRPGQVTALIAQNGNAYDEGLRDFWIPVKAYWADDTPAGRDKMRGGLTLEATRSQYLDGVADKSLIDPDSWLIDQMLIDRPGVSEIHLDLFKDYGSNVALYPQFHAFFRERKPPTLIAWGKNDFIFPPEGARAYMRDLPEAELNLIDSGHFALEDKGEEIATLIRDFLGRKLKA